MTQPFRPPAASAVDSPLFQPFRLNALDLPNRVVMAPMTRMFSPDHVPGDDKHAAYTIGYMRAARKKVSGE